jgi:hypothetical protein
VTALSTAEALRLRTFAPDIGKALFPAGTRSWVDGHDLRFPGGLAIHCERGCWFNWETNEGNYDTVDLIRHIQRLLKDATEDAEDYALAWLASHRGIGSCSKAADAFAGDDDTGSAIPASKAQAERSIAREIDLAGTLGAIYYQARGIDPALAAEIGIRFIEYARIGEHAVSAPLVCNGRVVGRALTYIGPDGHKTPLKHDRDTFLLEPAKGAVFVIPAALGAPADVACDLAVAEGCEDALSIAMLRRGFRIIGLVGISKLVRIEVAPDTKVTIFCDGDPPDHPARKGLIAGVDHLLLRKARVRLTSTPVGMDPNALLQKSLADLLSVFAAAEPIELSFHGECQRLTRIDDPFERALARKEIAKKFKVSGTVVDETVKKYEAILEPKEGAAPPAAYPVDEPWIGEVDIRAVFDAALVQAARYIVAPLYVLAILVLWCIHAHTVHNPRLRTQKSPRLAIQGREKGCGKTVTLEVGACLCARADNTSSYTASSIFRTIAADHPTLFLDEADRILKDESKGDLIAVLDCGDRRASAKIKRSVPTPKGGWRPEIFDVFGAVAFAGIDELPETLQDRSVRLFLTKATGEQVPEHLRDGTSSELVDIRRQLAAWNDKLEALPEDPVMPAVLLRQAGRMGDNWRPLFAIAEKIGGQAPDLIRTAALVELGAERNLSVLEELLIGIHVSYAAERTKHGKLRKDLGTAYDASDYPDNPERLRTKTITEYLLNDPDAEWDRKNHGRAITSYWVCRQLRGLLNPPNTQDWWTGPKGSQEHHTGYLRSQFEGTWATHPPPSTPQPPGETPVAPEPAYDFSKFYSSCSSGEAGVRGVQGVPIDFSSKSATQGTPPGEGLEGVSCDGEAQPAAGTPSTGVFRRCTETLRKAGETASTPRAPRTPRSPRENENKNIAVKPGDSKSQPRRKKPNGAEPTLDLPPAPVSPYPSDGIATAIRQLHAQHPERSLRWLSEKTGQPKSKVEEILRSDGEAQ